MTKTLNEPEKETLISLYLSGAIQKFPYPNEMFFEVNRSILKEKPNSSQLNGLWQMALNAESIDDMCNELIRKVSKSTLLEWHVKISNTLEVPPKDVELWEFLVRSLIYIRGAEEKDSFMNDWITKHQEIVNSLLRQNEYNGIDSIPISDRERLELARSFIHRFVTTIIVERKIREE
jgi:hypothetical protein